MNMKKIITAIIISVLISAGLYYGTSLAPTEALKAVLTTKLDLTMCVMIGAGFCVVYLLSSYRLKATPETEIPMKKFEYLYNQCDDELKAELNKLSDEDKLRYVESTESLLDNTKKNELSNYIHDLTTPQKPASMKVIGKLAFVAMLAFVGYTGYTTYTEAKPAIDEYMAMKNATYDDQVLYIEGLPPIQLVSGGTFKQIDVNNYIEKNIKNQPAFLLNCARSIDLYDDENFRSIGKAYGTLGFSNSASMAAHIKLTSIQTNDYTMTHELCHLFDFAQTNNYQYSASQDFVALYNAAPNSITEYGATNVHEFFAEAGAMYVNSPESLKSKNSEVYNYFDNLFGPLM